MKNQWNRQQLELCYRNTVPKFGDGYKHADRQGIPRFIEEYRLSRVKDSIAPWIVGETDATDTHNTEETMVLDIGCGHGWYPLHLIEKWQLKGHITGIDISSHNITLFQNEIKKRGYSEKLSASVANAENLPFPDNTFDIVYSTESLEHIESTDKFFSEAGRVLKSGGKLIITTPSGPMHRFWISIFWIPLKIKRLLHPRKDSIDSRVFEKSLSWKQIRTAYDSQEFKVENYHKSVMLPHESYIQFFPKIIQKILLRMAIKLEKSRALTRSLGLHHIICLIKI